ncbi:amino acid ABC transporter permease [Microbacterium rhizophilus]|uniref:amino acid ABC transporter permease n=1 Tax=Microbacterium rhizophilus TaxID=3138934 RepID=UPI0031EC4847
MGVITDHLDLWGEALLGTLKLFAGGGVLALVLGIVVGAMRVSPVPIARAVGTFYVNTIRNTPLTLVFFGFASALPPLIGVRASGGNEVLFAIGALGIYTATYVAETIRSGINTVPVGQAEAARAIGLSFGQVMTLVVLPQAFRSVIPPMMSVFIALLKNTTVAAGFAVMNLGSMRDWLSEQGENQLLVIVWVMIIFVALVMLLSWAQRTVEKRWTVAR